MSLPSQLKKMRRLRLNGFSFVRTQQLTGRAKEANKTQQTQANPFVSPSRLVARILSLQLTSTIAPCIRSEQTKAHDDYGYCHYSTVAYTDDACSALPLSERQSLVVYVSTSQKLLASTTTTVSLFPQQQLSNTIPTSKLEDH